MNSKIIGVLAGAALLLAASPAFAATISNPLFSNGDTTISTNGSGTVSGTFTLTVGTNEVVEYLRTQSDPSQPFTDTSVGGQLGYQEGVYTNVPFTVKVPPNTGTVYPTVQGAGIYGGIRSINGGDNVVVGPQTLGTVRVTSNGSTDAGGSTSISGGVFGFNSFADFLAAIKAGLGLTGSTSTTPAPAKPACPPSGNTSMVQVWLMNNNYGAGFFAAGLDANHPTGNWGPITTNAYNQATAACK